MTPLEWWNNKSVVTPFYGNYSLVRVGADGTNSPPHLLFFPQLLFSLPLLALYANTYIFSTAYRSSSMPLDPDVVDSVGEGTSNHIIMLPLSFFSLLFFFMYFSCSYD